MKEINVLVLGVGGNVSQGIITALRISKIPCRIIGACISPQSLGLFMCDTAYVSPYTKDDNFISWLIETCNIEQVDFILTGVEEIIYAIELNKAIIKEQTKAIFVSSNLLTLEIGSNKLTTSEWLKNNGLNYPKFADFNNSEEVDVLIQSCGFPLIAKPNNGKGSAGIFKIFTKEDLGKIPNKDYCIQEYLGDENQEYTVACYVNKEGKLLELILFRREIKYGTTFMAEIIDNDLIKNECIKICEILNPIGPLNIQLRMHKGIPVCFELNIRFSGTTPIRARFGYNDVEAMLKEYLFNENIDKLLNPHKNGKVYRYFNEFYVDQEMINELEINKKALIVKDFNNFQEDKQ